MELTSSANAPDLSAAAVLQLPPPTRFSWAHWVREGLRASVLLAPRIGGGQPAPWQLLVLVALRSLIDLALARLEVPGPAYFYLRGWLITWWSTAILLFIVWWILSPASASRARADQPHGVAAWFGLWMVASLPVGAVSMAMAVARARDLLPQVLLASTWQAWALYVALWSWSLAVALRLARRFGASRQGLVVLLLGLLAMGAVSEWQVQDRPWYPERAAAEEEAPKLALSQQAFEAQQAVWRQAVDALAPERAGVGDVYGLVFAPYADEDVFLRESSLVAKLLADRFDAQGRVLHLVNHVSTVQSHPWATPLNLERAIAALAARMDLEQDVLVIYLTSHGASDFKLAAQHWPLTVDPVTPAELRAALDKAGIQNRVIAVSACFAGGWIGPLASDSSLVMTAADATHTSYGCGRKSELTFFGRAVFDEQLRKTRSFEEAFAAAVPVIRQREIDAGKSDGFSNPQISVGERIKPVLASLQARLEAPKP
jgi:Peptidase C13 family